MRKLNMTLVAILAGFVAVAALADTTTVVNTDTSAETITVVNTDTATAAMPASPEMVFVNNSAAPRAERLAEIRADLERMGAVIACQRDHSMLVVDYHSGNVYLVYVVSPERVFSDSFSAKEGVTQDRFRRGVQQMCEDDILARYERDVNAALRSQQNN